MRVETTTTNIYSFDELTDEQKQKTIENLYDINVNYEWWDYIYDDAENIGLKITGFDIDRGSYVEGDFTNDAEICASSIIEEHGETCETYQTAKQYLEDRKNILNLETDDNTHEIDSKLELLDDEFIRSIRDDYLQLLRREYEYLTSEEAIIETIEANEYEFTADGKLY